MAIFPTFYFRQYITKNVFCDILEQKNAFLSYKNEKSKKLKNLHFFKGVKPCFRSKNGHIFKGVNTWFWFKNGYFSTFFFLGNIRQENIFSDILEGKSAFLGYKKEKSKKLKNLHFSKGVNPWFWPKRPIF